MYSVHINPPPKTVQVTMIEPPISKGPTSAPPTTPCCFSTIIGVEGGTGKKVDYRIKRLKFCQMHVEKTVEKLSVRQSDTSLISGNRNIL